MSDNDNNEKREKKVVSLSGAAKKSRTRNKEKSTVDKNDNQEVVYCSFCGRPNYMVIKMIKGPGVNICSECVMICIQFLILEDRIPAAEVQKVLDSFWRASKK
ncbi:MAG: ClpX C4-type zinc finger protein [bacterium]